MPCPTFGHALPAGPGKPRLDVGWRLLSCRTARPQAAEGQKQCGACFPAAKPQPVKSRAEGLVQLAILVGWHRRRLIPCSTKKSLILWRYRSHLGDIRSVSFSYSAGNTHSTN